MKLIGIDYGEKYIGISYSINGVIVEPHKVVEREKFTLEFSIIFEKIKPDKVIVGYPLLLSGDKGTMVHKVEKFAKEIKEKFKVEVIFFDERFTTELAKRYLMKDFIKIRTRKKKKIDKKKLSLISAVIILEDYLKFISK